MGVRDPAEPQGHVQIQEQAGFRRVCAVSQYDQAGKRSLQIFVSGARA